MKNLIELAANKTLHDLIDTTIREAIVLQKAANGEYAKQVELEAEKKPYNYAAVHALDRGVSALCNVLWRLFGGCTQDSINAIRRIAAENQSEILGHDSRDYIQLFMDAFDRG